MTPESPALDVWAIVELLGHVRLGGKLTEEEKFGGKLGRLDIPHGDRFVTRYFGCSSVYSITIVSEEAARAVAVSMPAPVSAWEIPAPPKALAPRHGFDDSLDQDEESGDEFDRS